MPDMLRRFFERSDKGKIASLEREAIEHLKIWRSTTDLKLRSDAWQGLMKCADGLVKPEGKK